MKPCRIHPGHIADGAVAGGDDFEGFTTGLADLKWSRNGTSNYALRTRSTLELISWCLLKTTSRSSQNEQIRSDGACI